MPEKMPHQVKQRLTTEAYRALGINRDAFIPLIRQQAEEFGFPRFVTMNLAERVDTHIVRMAARENLPKFANQSMTVGDILKITASNALRSRNIKFQYYVDESLKDIRLSDFQKTHRLRLLQVEGLGDGGILGLLVGKNVLRTADEVRARLLGTAPASAPADQALPVSLTQTSAMDAGKLLGLAGRFIALLKIGDPDVTQRMAKLVSREERRAILADTLRRPGENTGKPGNDR